jgi:hypothetical protein
MKQRDMAEKVSAASNGEHICKKSSIYNLAAFNLGLN